MPNQVMREDVIHWLERNGFSRRDGRKGHLQYTNGATLVTLVGHGPRDLTKKHVGQIVRHLVQAGFDRETVNRGLRGES
jgi:predicted RNA binding protein YcfA (HicA-like mRNA interferase family)